MVLPEKTTDPVDLYFTRIILSPEQYVDTEYFTLSVCLFSIFWSYVIVMTLSCCYHWNRVISKVNDQKNPQPHVKMEQINHHEYGIDSNIWCPSPSTVSGAQVFQKTDLNHKEETVQLRRFPEKSPKRSVSVKVELQY